MLQSAARFVSDLSIGLKLAASTVLVLSLVSVLVAGQVIEGTRDNLVEAKATAARMVADLTAAALAAPLDFQDTEAAHTELEKLQSSRALLHAVVWSEAGVATASIGGEVPDMQRHRLARDGTERVLQDRIIVARPVLRADGKRLGAVAIALSLQDENVAFAAAKQRIWGFSLLVACLTALLLVGMSRWQIVGPLERLVSAARRLGKGERAVRVEVASNDELGRLANVFNSMSEAIVEREERLAMAMRSLRELFDNMRQAIVVFNPGGVLEGEPSRQARELFGERAEPGNTIEALLYGERAQGVECEALRQWLPLAFEAGPDDWTAVEQFAPKETVLEQFGGERRFATLEFRPIVQGSAVARIMLLATDVTALRQLENQVRHKEQDHARQMAAMRRLVAGGGQVFVGFVEASVARAQRCLELLDTERLAPGLVDELFQHMHTIKGEARAFDLHRLATEAAAFEEELAQVQVRARSERGLDLAPRLEQWRAHLAKIRDALSEAQELFIAASPIGRAVLDQITVSRSDVTRLHALCSSRRDEVARIVERLAARPFGQATATLADRVPGWAEALGKRARLDIEGKETLVPPTLARVLPGVLMHLVRNSLAHGIEVPEERVAADKPEIGLIQLSCKETSSGLSIRVTDDGAGIDVEALRSHSTWRPSMVVGSAEVVFEPGVTSKTIVSDIAGRGVGLSAVRSDLEEVGWMIEIDGESELGTAFVIRPQIRGRKPV
jgi:HPt (histidine-containing phosphotransfer) domain-containing protein